MSELGAVQILHGKEYRGQCKSQRSKLEGINIDPSVEAVERSCESPRRPGLNLKFVIRGPDQNQWSIRDSRVPPVISVVNQRVELDLAGLAGSPCAFRYRQAE